MEPNGEERLVPIEAGSVLLEGNLSLSEGARGIVLFAHGSGSSRLSPQAGTDPVRVVVLFLMLLLALALTYIALILVDPPRARARCNRHECHRSHFRHPARSA